MEETALPIDRRALVSGAAAALALTGWSSARAAQTVRVRIPAARTAFEPSEVRIKIGDTVQWTNRSIVAHSVTCDPSKAKDKASVNLPAGAGAFDSGEIGEDGVFSHTFTAAGTYRYFCIEHENMGMNAVVVVEA